MVLPLQITIGYILINVLYRRLVCIIIAKGVWPGDEASTVIWEMFKLKKFQKINFRIKKIWQKR